MARRGTADDRAARGRVRALFPGGEQRLVVSAPTRQRVAIVVDVADRVLRARGGTPSGRLKRLYDALTDPGPGPLLDRPDAATGLVDALGETRLIRLVDLLQSPVWTPADFTRLRTVCGVLAQALQLCRTVPGGVAEHVAGATLRPLRQGLSLRLELPPETVRLWWAQERDAGVRHALLSHLPFGAVRRAAWVTAVLDAERAARQGGAEVRVELPGTGESLRLLDAQSTVASRRDLSAPEARRLLRQTGSDVCQPLALRADWPELAAEALRTDDLEWAGPPGARAQPPSAARVPWLASAALLLSDTTPYDWPWRGPVASWEPAWHVPYAALDPAAQRRLVLEHGAALPASALTSWLQALAARGVPAAGFTGPEVARLLAMLRCAPATGRWWTASTGRCTSARWSSTVRIPRTRVRSIPPWPPTRSPRCGSGPARRMRAAWTSPWRRRRC